MDSEGQSPPAKMLYQSYLVRLWQDTPDTPWCASAQSAQSGEIVRFGTLQALFAFLEAQTSGSKRANAPPRANDGQPDV